MSDNDMPPKPTTRATLRFTGSESLADVVNNVLIKPELRREFARRSFYLFLRTEAPVDIPYQSKSLERMLGGHDALEMYNAGIAQPHKGRDLYTSHFPLSSRDIGGAEHPAPSRGVSLLFRLAIGEYEKQRLLAPPFDNVTAGAVYVAQAIDERWLADDVLSDDRARSRVFQKLRSQLGANHASIQDRGYLPDSYYVTRPAGVVVPNQWPSGHGPDVRK